MAFLSASEWDFSQLTDREIYSATFYEYARSMPEVRASLDSWFNRPLREPYVRRSLKTVRDVVKLYRERLAKEATVHRKVPTAFSRIYAVLVEAAVQSLGFATPQSAIGTTYWEFPDPWMEIRMRNAVPRIEPIPEQEPVVERGWEVGFEEVFPAEKRSGIVTAWIDLSYSRSELEESFRRFLDARPETKLRKGHHSGRKDALRALSAYRLSLHTEDFKVVKAEVESEWRRKVSDHGLLPLFASKQKWRESAKRAEEIVDAGELERLSDFFLKPRAN